MGLTLWRRLGVRGRSIVMSLLAALALGALAPLANAAFAPLDPTTTVFTLAGGGTGRLVSGAFATQVPLHPFAAPNGGMAVLTDGSIVLKVDEGDGRLVRIMPSGRIRLVPNPRLGRHRVELSGLAAGPRGTLLATLYFEPILVRVNLATNRAKVIANLTRLRGFDIAGQATHGPAIAPDGALWVWNDGIARISPGRHRVRLISRIQAETVVPLAGTDYTYAGGREDHAITLVRGGKRTRLVTYLLGDDPAIAGLPDGSLIAVDAHGLRHVTLDGHVTTLTTDAPGGPGFGDGGPLEPATIGGFALATGADGMVLVAEYGVIRAIVGAGTPWALQAMTRATYDDFATTGRVHVVSTIAGAAHLELIGAAGRVAQASGSIATPGEATLALPGPPPPGEFTLALTVTAPDGRVVRSRLFVITLTSLTVKRAREEVASDRPNGDGDDQFVYGEKVGACRAVDPGNVECQVINYSDSYDDGRHTGHSESCGRVATVSLAPDYLRLTYGDVGCKSFPVS